jgi:glycerol uptake facilitator-like aquaporin
VAPFTLSRKLCAEFLGTMLLLAVVVGSGIMGERLAGGNDAVALLGNTLATGVALTVLIMILGPISGCHINPAVTLSFVMQGQIRFPLAAGYVAVQVAGAIAGVVLAHAMFDLPLIAASTNARTGMGQWLGEVVATFGLVAVIVGCLRFRPQAVSVAVGLYISAGYWFTSSTSFANPAVTVGRALTDTFTGIRPVDVPAFVLAQVVGAVLATLLFRWLLTERMEDVSTPVLRPLRVDRDSDYGPW